MNNEELINFPDNLPDNLEDWVNLNAYTTNNMSTQYNYDRFYGNPYDNINFYEFKNKLLEEIRFKIGHLEQSLEVVREKNSKQFIKGQIVALNEIRCSIERNDWACDRGEYYVGW